jgi:hypothetical protein
MAASFSVNLPLAMISSKSSPPLQILFSVKIIISLLSDNVISLLIFEELVHLNNVWMILKKFKYQNILRYFKDMPIAFRILELNRADKIGVDS